MLDVGWGDLIYYLGDDPNTKSIVIYMETIGDARAFLSAAREVALTKPIIVIKPGRTEAAAKAAASHTGSLTGSDEVLRRRVPARAACCAWTPFPNCSTWPKCSAKQPRPQGPAPDHRHQRRRPGRARHRHAHHQRRRSSPNSRQETMEAFNKILPAAWSHNNPVDIIGDASRNFTPRRWKSPPKTRTPTACWSFSRRRR